jgi:transcriptional regulator with XRE-family HTH domain
MTLLSCVIWLCWRLIGRARRALAGKLGVSERQYSNYESGYTKIDLPLEYAVRWLSVAPIVRENSAGTLTDFQKERINRLMDAIDEYPVSNLDEKGQKILLQCVDEISTLVDSVA